MSRFVFIIIAILKTRFVFHCYIKNPLQINVHSNNNNNKIRTTKTRTEQEKRRGREGAERDTYLA